MRHLLALTLLSVAMTGCGSMPMPMPPPQLPSPSPVEQFVDTWNRHDMRAFADLFAPDAQFVNVVGLWWKGRDEIYGAHAFVHSNMFKSSRLTALETVIRTPTDGLAIARTRWRLEGHTTPDGKALPPRTGLLVMVLQRTGAAWLIVDAQNTDIVADEITRPQ